MLTFDAIGLIGQEDIYNLTYIASFKDTIYRDVGDNGVISFIDTLSLLFNSTYVDYSKLDIGDKYKEHLKRIKIYVSDYVNGDDVDELERVTNSLLHSSRIEQLFTFVPTLSIFSDAQSLMFSGLYEKLSYSQAETIGMPLMWLLCRTAQNRIPTLFIQEVKSKMTYLTKIVYEGYTDEFTGKHVSIFAKLLPVQGGLSSLDALINH